MKRYLISLLVICLVLSMSFVTAMASTEYNTENETIDGVSYIYDSSSIDASIFADDEIVEILLQVEEKLINNNSTDNYVLSDLLTPEEMSIFNEKGIDPTSIEVTVVKAIATNIPQVSPQAQDTVSYSKSTNYSFLSILGSSTFKISATWECYKPTGSITVKSRSLTHVSGPKGTYSSVVSGNIISTWHTFSNASQTQTLSFGFRLTTGGNIVQS